MWNWGSSPDSAETAVIGVTVGLSLAKAPGSVVVVVAVMLLILVLVVLEFAIGLFSLPLSGDVTPGIDGKFFGGDLAIGEFLNCNRNARSYIIRVPPGVVENNVPPGVEL